MATREARSGARCQLPTVGVRVGVGGLEGGRDLKGVVGDLKERSDIRSGVADLRTIAVMKLIEGKLKYHVN